LPFTWHRTRFMVISVEILPFTRRKVFKCHIGCLAGSMEIEDLLAQFGVDLETFVEALRRSPNARGYIDGAISELLIQRKLEKLGFELLRIKEKWKGPKKHFGDFYISKKGDDKWYVLESKGVKSNSEDWHKLFKRESLAGFLREHGERLGLFDTEREIDNWIEKYYTSDKRELLKRVRVLETHFVSGKGTAGRRIATPRKDEFDYIALDLFLRTGKREYIFADPKDLDSARGYAEHLKQNYVVDILLEGVRSEPVIRPPWHKSIMGIWDERKRPVTKEDRQVDTRSDL
jgi:hypothetical protein